MGLHGIFLPALLLFLLTLSPVVQAAPNRALELDGEGDYVRLPDDLFTGLREATISCWVKWEEPRYYAQPFAFGHGEQWRALGINFWQNTSILQFFIYDSQSKLHLIRVGHDLGPGRWHHIAAVSGKGGMKLYLNGALAAQDEYPGSFAALGRTGENYLGRSNWKENADFFGRIDEVRVWDRALGAGEIGAAALRRGGDPGEGLVAWWHFDDGCAEGRVEDASGAGHHGRLVGDARCVEDALPAALVAPAVVSGVVADAAGLSLAGVRVQLERQGQEVARILSSADNGRYNLVTLGGGGRFDLGATSGQLGSWEMGVELRAGERRRQDLTLRENISIEGALLTLDDSKFHEQVLVEVVAAADGQVAARTLSGPGGRYRFVNLRPGQYRVRCRIPDRDIYYGPGAEGSTLRIVQGKKQVRVDLRFAPFKKGTWKTLTYLDGLASNRVLVAHQQAGGDLWLGTELGLSRYDGQSFFNYVEKDGLPAAPVRAIHEDGAGVLWLGTEGGLSRYDGRTFSNYAEKDGLPAPPVWAVHGDGAGVLWLGTEGGLSRYDGRTFSNFTSDRAPIRSPVRAVQEFVSEEAPSREAVQKIWQDEEGVLWLGTRGGGVWRYDGDQFVNYFMTGLLASNTIRDLERGPDGQIWAGTWGDGIWRFDGRSWKQLLLPSEAGDATNPYISSFFRDADGVLWLGTRGGVWRFDGRRFVNFTTADGLVDNQVLTVFRDADGVLWAGTESGLSRYDEASLVNFTTADGLPDNQVLAIHRVADGSLWLGTRQGGAARYDGRDFASFSMPDGLAGTRITSLVDDGNGSLWLGSSNWGLSHYDGERFVTYRTPEGLKGSQVHTLYREEGGALWVGTEGSLSRFEGGRFTNYWTEDGLHSGPVRALHRDGEVLWIGGDRGLYCYDGRVFSACAGAEDLADAPVRALHRDGEGVLWIGTDRGLWRYDGARPTRYTRGEGLVDQDVRAVFRDRSGLLWVGTRNAGVAAFDGQVWTSLDTRDGLAGNWVSAIHQAGDGALFFGTDGGLTRFRRSRTPPRLHMATPALAGVAGHHLEIHCRVIDFQTLSEKIQYRYRIEELDSDWRRPTHQQYFEWTPEQAGTYTLWAQAVDRNLNYSEPVRVRIEVRPPWHRNPWVAGPAGGAVLILIALTFFSSTRYYAQRRRAEEALLRSHEGLERQVQERTADLSEANRALQEEIGERRRTQEQLVESLHEKEVLLREIHHRVKNNLQIVSSMISLQVSTVQAEEVRRLFEDSRNRIQSMALVHEQLYQSEDLARVDLSQYIAILVGDLMRAYGIEDERVVVDLHIEKVTPDIDAAIPCGLIVNELVSNALKHAFPGERRGRIEVELKRLGEQGCSLRVRDDGRGLPEGLDYRKTSSLGLKLVNALARQLRGEIECRSGEGGTEFRLVCDRI